MSEAKHADDPPVCIKCGDEYHLPDGYEATAYCDLCAQELVPELLEALEHMVAVSNWATTIQSEEQYDAMIASAEAAIRKAKGQ